MKKLITVITFITISISSPSIASDFDKKQLSEGCNIALENMSKFVSENSIKNTMLKVSGLKIKSYNDFCIQYAQAFLNFYEHKDIYIDKAKIPFKELTNILGQDKNRPELFDPDNRKCLVNGKNGELVDSPSNCNIGCLKYIFNQKDYIKRIGFLAGHQITTQVGRFNLISDAYLTNDLSSCLDVNNPTFYQCLLNTCIPANRVYEKK